MLKDNKSGSDLTIEKLTEYGFKMEENTDSDGEAYTTWSNDHLTLFETNKNHFCFCDNRREDGSFKSGFTISTDSQLENLFYSLTNKLLRIEKEPDDKR